MTIKRIVSACLPSYFVDRVRARRFERELAEQQRKDRDEAERERAEREASSWADAVNRSGAYDAERLTLFRVARHALHKPTGELLRSNILNIVARTIDKPNIMVTDFGGATGELGQDFAMEFPLSTYTVVELKSLIALMSDSEALRFVTDIPTSCDIFYSSGALQYLENPMDILRSGISSAKHAVILRRNHFSEDRRFDIQYSHLFENGFGAIPPGFTDSILSYPRQTLSESAILKLAECKGFDCIINNEDAQSPDGYSKQLVFLRKS